MPVIQKKRVACIDALRGFALAGIVIVHMLENYIAGPAPDFFNQQVNPALIDQIIEGLSGFFLRGKFFALFSLLFGLSFFIQMKNAERRDESYAARFAWRLLLLLGFGLMHHLFYRGDILTIYALLGFLLIPVFRASDKTLIILIALIFAGTFRYAVYALTGGDTIFGMPVIDPDQEMISDYYNTLSKGSLTDVFKTNATEGHLLKLEFQFNIFYRGFLTYGFFLIGLLLGRKDLFNAVEEGLVPKKKFWLITSGGLLLSLVMTGVMFSLLGEQADLRSWVAMLGLTFYDLANLFLTLIILGLFTLGWNKSRGKRFLGYFAPYGRMALTNYLLQTIIGTFILYGWGLGYIGSIRNSLMILIALAVIFLQMWWSRWWLEHFYYGPFEYVWRCLTWFKIMPFKKV
ncbi:DUF418 domain-containing protein [Robertkochia aurantiaca]|uniref:DUF418 domain-containing protein n=1 Tax=Robertkochia aurantiaca TaxID=2873700 RepID=UPI001CCC8AB5|nr:DUF418 domain-containing protein [Robertkochia sp. 3YJGBD-33]